MMKKVILAIAVAAMMAPAAQAQRPNSQLTDRDQITMLQNQVGKERSQYTEQRDNEMNEASFSNTSYFNISYIFDQKFEPENGPSVDTDWGAAIELGNSFMFPKKAIGGMFKLGFDVTWIDLSGAHFKNDVNDDNSYQLTAGMGFGLSAHVAPFAWVNNPVRAMRLEAFCRFVPSYSMIATKYDGKDKLETEGAFLPQVAYGAAISYRWFGIGAELRNGKGEYKPDGAKYKAKTPSSRVFITFKF